MAGLIRDSRLKCDVYDGGAYRVAGTASKRGVAGRYRVRLFDRFSARFLYETWSATDGSYVFNNIAYRQNGYFVIEFDHNDILLNAAIADLVTPEPMP